MTPKSSSTDLSRELQGLLSREGLGDLAEPEAGILSTVGRAQPSRNQRFEGFYGGLYTRVMRAPALRRAMFSLWGSADPLYELRAFAGDAARFARSSGDTPVLVDLPSGGGTLLPLLVEEGFNGTVVEVDLAMPMLRRAVVVHRSSAPHLRAIFLQGDALALPLRDEVADVVVSINGLHVMPDHSRFLAEAARITKRGGRLWLITPVDGPSVRSHAILSAANRLGITPRHPPTLSDLRRLLDDAGFRELHWYGGMSITGFACERVAAG